MNLEHRLPFCYFLLLQNLTSTNLILFVNLKYKITECLKHKIALIYRWRGLHRRVTVEEAVLGLVVVADVKLDCHPRFPAPKDVVMEVVVDARASVDEGSSADNPARVEAEIPVVG